ncbi:hypothetical protein E1286_14645 [Nonomuraea terrae]|uniref:Mycothiol-dependent maleylpyruvate isomerase metal-binding domain-containing protein n=1 Tax=Nonomuraea terrae TaxID=2530383 RepID=A0A4R4YXD8_9ACTN|nr:maleylpyruvate isomerase N-terminal domain-containing protein [Nonomuraea terrae]TDD49069.1 hypothetical protein E1286_14645 [Nonomuraea terrae]
MNEWDATSLAVVRAGLPEEDWEAPTACAGWAVRDVVAHIADKGYFAGFDAARGGGDNGAAYGLPALSRSSSSFCGTPRSATACSFTRAHAGLRAHAGHPVRAR